MNYVRRFVFVHYEDLLEIRFQKLEKVTDKLFIFIPSDVDSVPLSLVRQMQKMGPDLEWVEVGDATREVADQILTFRLGSLHESVDLGVEFAVFSDESSLDGLLEYIQEAGRPCLRVKQNPEEEPRVEVTRLQNPELIARAKASSKRMAPRSARISNGSAEAPASSAVVDLDEEDLEAEPPAVLTFSDGLAEGATEYQAFVKAGKTNAKRKPRRAASMRQPLHSQASAPLDTTSEIVAAMADELARRLIRSGNRPGDISMLRSYILLHSNEAEAARHVDDIIGHMEQKGEISIADDQVSYTF